jgi:hypothetical protein
MVSEDDAAALVVRLAQELALKGHAPRITHENGPRLVMLGRQLLAEFGVAGDPENPEGDDG